MLRGEYDMQIKTYRTELNENQHNILVQESCHECPQMALESPKAITDMLNAVFNLKNLAEEYVYMIAFNTKNRPLGVFEVSHGTVNQSVCNPRELFIRALLCGAVYIILAHNHPSGDTVPSKEDIENYERVKEAGRLIGIQLLDSIIVGDGYFSFREEEM